MGIVSNICKERIVLSRQAPKWVSGKTEFSCVLEWSYNIVKIFYQRIVQRRKPIFVVFILLAVCGLFLQTMVAVNYDMKDYLPQDSQSTVSIQVMQNEFSGGIPNARVMIYDVSLAEALAYKEQLAACPGVTEVIWLDDAVDIYMPLEVLDTDVVESYYKNDTALFTLTIEEEKRIEAVEAIRNVIGDENAMSGEAVSGAVAAVRTVSEIKIISLVGILFAFAVLFLTTRSWLEPLVVMGGLGVAVAINAGSNIIFGEISFVTNAAGNILQLAVSLDYSVFLMHRFEECLQEENNVQTAMVNALSQSTSSILSSGLTTVIGFLALIFMRFGIGPDLGLALAKGVAISLISVFVFMPSFILLCHPIIKRLKHRSFLPDFHRFGRVVCRFMLPMVGVFFLVLAPSYLAANANSFYYGSSHIFGLETQTGADSAAIEAVFGKNDTYVLLVSKGDLVKEKQLSNELHDMPQVKSILSYVDTVGTEIPTEYLDADTLSQLMSEHYSRMVLSVEADYEGTETFALVENIRRLAEEYYPNSYYLAGEGVSTYDLMSTTTADMRKVNWIAICAVFFVLVLMMKSISLPILLVVGIETAIWLNLSVPYFANTTVFYISYLIISSIQLGATVDYAILFTDRYMEFRRDMPKREALLQTISAVTASILTSGTVLTVVGYLLGYISSHGILAQLGLFLGRGGVFSMTIVLFVLPGLLYIFDGIVHRSTWKGRATGKASV